MGFSAAACKIDLLACNNITKLSKLPYSLKIPPAQLVGVVHKLHDMFIVVGGVVFQIVLIYCKNIFYEDVMFFKLRYKT